MKRQMLREITWECAECNTRAEGYIVDGDFLPSDEARNPENEWVWGCPICGCMVGSEVTAEELAEEWDYEDGVEA